MTFTNRLEPLLTAAMLLLLHTAISLGPENAIAKSVILAHLGFFLLWQPIWRGDQKLNWQNTLVFLVLTVIFLYWLDWWLITGWLILLIGLTGGRIARSTSERNVNIIILSFLVIELLIKCAGNLFPIRLTPGISGSFDTLLVILPLIILFLPKPAKRQADNRQPIDLFSAITTSLLASLLLLGSLINSYPLTDKDYIYAVIQTFLFIGIFLLLISWLVSPKTGFSGLAQLWTQSLLNIGTPFEQWVSNIASLSSETTTPEEFIETATERLLSLPMIEGVKWHVGDQNGTHGIEGRNSTDIQSVNLFVRIMTSRSPGATLILHFKLLVTIIDHFYVAKLQERKLARQAHLQAIHETGARVTHDIKNLLQSLSNLTAIISSDSETRQQDTFALLERQLPLLTERLQLALDKLQAPWPADTPAQESLMTWWEQLKHRNLYETVTYHSSITHDKSIPVELFDSVVDNLLENYHAKEQVHTGITATVSATSTEEYLELEICDTGPPIPEDIAKRLFKEPLKSSAGLGIGLLQAHDLAEQLGYHLELKHNEEGNVCFVLHSETRSTV